MTGEITAHEPLHSNNTRHVSGQYMEILHKICYSRPEQLFLMKLIVFQKQFTIYGIVYVCIYNRCEV